MKKCLHCGMIIYCTKECCDTDWPKHKPLCDDIVLDRQMGRAEMPTQSSLLGEECMVIPAFMEEIIPYFQSFGISHGTCKILFTACSKGSSVSIAEHIEELTSHPLGKLIGSRLYAERQKIKPALERSYLRFDHPFFRYGSEVVEGMCKYYDDNPDDVRGNPANFAPPTNMDQWFSKEHI